ncbi:MAG: DUF5816 domain-containing protein [Halanaeroarchaeum sp.]
METVETNDGDTLYVATNERLSGQTGPFFAVYRSADRERKYGWYCEVCGSTDNAMDTMGRIKCNECGNLRKPDQWDAAHE